MNLEIKKINCLKTFSLLAFMTFSVETVTHTMNPINNINNYHKCFVHQRNLVYDYLIL